MNPAPVTDRTAQFNAIIPTLPDGDIAELGVYQGGATIRLAQFGRTVWAFDTFSGMPEAGYVARYDSENPPGKFNPGGIPEVFKAYPNIRPVQGNFLDTLPTFDEGVKIAFVYIDCDNYNSYISALWFAASRIVDGGRILCDDYCCDGARRAINEFTRIAPWYLTQENSLLVRSA